MEFAYSLQNLCKDIESPKDITDDFATDVNIFAGYFNVRDKRSAGLANSTTQMWLSNGKEATNAESLKNDVLRIIRDRRFQKLNKLVKARPWILDLACERYFGGYDPKKSGEFATKGSLKSIGATNMASPINRTV